MLKFSFSFSFRLDNDQQFLESPIQVRSLMYVDNNSQNDQTNLNLLFVFLISYNLTQHLLHLNNHFISTVLGYIG